MYVGHPGGLPGVLTSRRGRRPVCPAERSSALGATVHQRGRVGRKTDRKFDYLPIGSGLSRSRLPAGLAPGRPDDGVWAYVFVVIASVFQTETALR